MPNPNCKICGSPTDTALEGYFLGRYRAPLHFCQNCGFLFVDEPHWLAEAYQSAISPLDTGVLFRNIDIARRLSTLLFVVFGERGKGRYLDMAGGYGILTRAMRDAGFDFYWSDKYSENVMAKGFEAANQNFSGATAFEVAEHLSDPKTFFREALEQANGLLIFSTELFHGEPPQKDWWYYAFEGGQHISFYQPRTLQHVAISLGVSYISAMGLHIFSRRAIDRRLLKVASNRHLAPLLSAFRKRRMPSHTFSDHVLMKAKVI